MLTSLDLPVSQLCLSFFRLDLSTTSLSCPLSVLLNVTDFTPPELVVSLSLLCASFVVAAERCRFLVLPKLVMCCFRSFAFSRASVCCHMSLSVPATSLFQLNVCSPFRMNGTKRWNTTVAAAFVLRSAKFHIVPMNARMKSRNGRICLM